MWNTKNVHLSFGFKCFEFWHEYFCSLLQRGHIYTSTGSFFIEPIEKYTLDNQNILHKITREKLPIDQMSIDKYRNGKVFVDEIGLHEDEDEDEKTEDDDEEMEDELDSNESILDETTTNNGSVNVDAPIVTCISGDSKSK